jgi:hypothetical protein
MAAFMEDDPMPRFTRRDLLAAAPALGVAAVLAGSREARADQPHMDAALDALKSARRELDAATADKGGHRGNAPPSGQAGDHRGRARHRLREAATDRGVDPRRAGEALEAAMYSAGNPNSGPGGRGCGSTYDGLRGRPRSYQQR